MTALCDGVYQSDNRGKQQHRLLNLRHCSEARLVIDGQYDNILILCKFRIRRKIPRDKCPRAQILESNSIEGWGSRF